MHLKPLLDLINSETNEINLGTWQALRINSGVFDKSDTRLNIFGFGIVKFGMLPLHNGLDISFNN